MTTIDEEVLARVGLGGLDACEQELLLACLRARADDQLARGRGTAGDGGHPDEQVLAEAVRDEVIAELADVADVILAVAGPGAPADGHRHQRQDPGPVLVTGRGWSFVVSSLGAAIVAVAPSGTVLYARRGDAPAVVLLLPDGHRVDAASVWCDDRGQVRAAFGRHADLRWRLTATCGSPTLGFEKVLRHPRPSLVSLDHGDGGGPVTLQQDRWRIDPQHSTAVTDRRSGATFHLEPPFDGPYVGVVDPHLLPDGSQLVTAHRAAPPAIGGVHACSLQYFDAVVGSLDAQSERRWPWEHEFLLEVGSAHADPPHEVVEGLGYDASSTRAALLDERHAHVLHTRAWSELGAIDRPDGQARVERLPMRRPPVLAAWGERSLVAVDDEGALLRIDLRDGEDLQAVDGAPPVVDPVAVLRLDASIVVLSGDRTMVEVDERGRARVDRLPGNRPLVAGAAFDDGRLLVATATDLELWSGRQLLWAEPVDRAPVTGLAIGTRDATWAVAWLADGSLSAWRIARRRLHAEPRGLPFRSAGGSVMAVDRAVLAAADDWHLGGRASDGRPQVVAADGTASAGRLLGRLPGGRVIREAGSVLDLGADPTATTISVDVGEPVRAAVAGPCPRSLAVLTDTGLALVRLLS